MANTSEFHARIDTNIKENAEAILSQLGISPSIAVQMLYSQIILHKGMPFEQKLPATKPLALKNMTATELDEELNKGLASLSNGTGLSADDLDSMLNKEFGI